MGHKRKASDSLSPLSTSSSPLITSPSHPLQHFQSPHSNHISLPGWGSPEPYFANGILNSSPYHPSTDTRSSADHLNSRTRKRFRDNRPDEETIHQITLSKLFSAQRNGTHKSGSEDQRHSTPSPTSSHASLPTTTSNNMSTRSEKSKAHHQTSLHAFFGGSQHKPTHTTTAATSPGPDPQSSTTTRATIAIACCEDCSAPLLPYQAAASADMMDMDIDPNPNAHFAVPTTVDADADADAYACAYCAKTVCDMCAVRGDVRVCLECANPGNGSRATNGFGHHSNNNNTGVAVSCGMEAGNAVYGGGGVPAAATAVGGRAGDGGMMLGQKRWVGGIGWM